jgi:hypothetical protein
LWAVFSNRTSAEMSCALCAACGLIGAQLGAPARGLDARLTFARGARPAGESFSSAPTPFAPCKRF